MGRVHPNMQLDLRSYLESMNEEVGSQMEVKKEVSMGAEVPFENRLIQALEGLKGNRDGVKVEILEYASGLKPKELID